MKEFLAAVSIAMLVASPVALAQSNIDSSDVEPAQGPLNAQVEQGTSAGVGNTSVTTGTLVGIGAGVLAVGALIALAADGDDDGDNVDLSPTPTTTTTN